MAIGVFDSGVGGLSIHRALVERMPQADFIYLGDQAHAPYGGRPGEEIVDLTRAGCERLFAAGASLVVLACNTASAIALRRLQQAWLPAQRASLGRPVNVLGIIVPTIEAATGVPWHREAPSGAKTERRATLAVFATAGTIRSDVYGIEIRKRRPDLHVAGEACPDLAGLIEAGAPDDTLAPIVQGHVQAVTARLGGAPDHAILGCTHYELIEHLFRAALPAQTQLIRQPDSVADALSYYKMLHREFDLGKSGQRIFLTTGKPGMQSDLVGRFWGDALHFDQA